MQKKYTQEQVASVVLPKLGEFIILGEKVYKVMALNQGKLRFSATFVGVKQKEREKKGFKIQLPKFWKKSKS